MPSWLSGKESICQCRRHGFHPTSRLGASPGARNGNPLQYSHLGNPMGRGLWQATVHSVTKSRTRLSDLTTAIIWGRGWWYDLMTGGSELKLEKGVCTERSSWGARRTLPHPHTWWHQGHGRKRLLERWQGEPCPQGTVRLFALECEGSIQDTSDFTDEGSRDQQGAGDRSKQCLGLRGDDTAHCQYCSSCWRSQSAGKQQKKNDKEIKRCFQVV